MYSLEIVRHLLHFKQPAGTSRGVYKTRRVWYLLLKDSYGDYGIGECAPLRDLSCDAMSDAEYECKLKEFCADFVRTGVIDYACYKNFPSMLFGMETAFLALKAKSWAFAPLFNQYYHYPRFLSEENKSREAFAEAWLKGERGITINGLIWMGDYDTMYQRIQEKLDQGFHCIKLKIGAINFEQEIALLDYMRQHFPSRELELRVDANGAFSPAGAFEKLKSLSKFSLHSIEQPIKAGQYEALAKLTAATPLPIALDEELIGINDREAKAQLLDTVKPQYIVLKPSLHGGIQGSLEWIELAQERHIGYWITSALESNIGLNALAQFVSTLSPELPQGLGTGLLFTDQVELPLHIKGEALYFDPQGQGEDIAAYLKRNGASTVAVLKGE